eukprot:13918160-Alexandrium_andersonii.AAC.1
MVDASSPQPSGAGKRPLGEDFNEQQSKRRLRRQTSEAVVAKAIADNFRGWSEEDVDINVVNNETLRQRLRRDKRTQRESGLVMGAVYYKNLKTLYRPKSDPLSQLVAPNPPQPVSPQLMKAMVAVKRAHPDRTLMSSWLACSTKPNETEVVGVF